MKKIVCIILLLVAIDSKGNDLMFNRNLYMPSSGFWVIEGNVEISKNASVFYYDKFSNLIYSEPIRLRSKRFLNNGVKRKLNKRLENLLKNRLN